MKRFDEPFLVYLQEYKSLKDNIEFQHVADFMREQFDEFASNLILPYGQTVPEIEFNLFLWALLSNRIEIAKIFWTLGKVFYIYKIQIMVYFYFYTESDK